MAEYDFALRFSVPTAGVAVDEHVERLGAAGCDDALIGIGRPGRLAMDFTRGASSARQAVLSAIADVGSAIPDARLLEAKPDLVSVTEIAEMVGCSRQNVRRLLLTAGPSAPSPVHEGRPSIWHLAPVLVWLREQKGYEITDGLVEIAETAMQVNIAIDSGRADTGVQRDVRALLA